MLNHLVDVDVALRSRVLKHIVEQVRNTPLERQPFPHFVLGDFLPQDFYNDLLAKLPAPSLYEPFVDLKYHRDTGTTNRFRFQFTNWWLSRLPDRQRVAWATLRSVIGSQELKQSVFEKLAPGLSLRYGVSETDASRMPGFALPELFRETEGYSIKPHPDTRKKVVTMQLALAEHEGQRDLGTEFYRSSFDPRHWLRAPRGFDVVKRAPFIPNTVYAFSVLNLLTLKSWHGRTAIRGDFGVRNSLLNIWYQNPEHGNSDLIEDSNWFASQSSQPRAAA